MDKITKNTNETSPKIDLKKELAKNKILVIALVAILLSGVAYFLRGAFIAATVNGQPISRFAVIRQLEKYQGESALESIVMTTLINQEARKKGVTVSNDEVNDEMKKLEASFEGSEQTIDQALEQSKMTRDDLKDQIKTQKIVQKLLGEKVNVTDEEVEQYIKDNPESFEGVEMDSQTKDVIKSQLAANKISSEYDAFYNQIKSAAKINYIFKY